jgi:hypothetical protein
MMLSLRPRRTGSPSRWARLMRQNNVSNIVEVCASAPHFARPQDLIPLHWDEMLVLAPKYTRLDQSEAQKLRRPHVCFVADLGNGPDERDIERRSVSVLSKDGVDGTWEAATTSEDDAAVLGQGQVDQWASAEINRSLKRAPPSVPGCIAQCGPPI